MADSANITVVAEQQNYRNTVVRASLVSDGTGLANFVLIDPTVAATGAVNLSVTQAGQVFYPGIHLKIMRIYYDVQDMKLRLQWKATTNQDVEVFGNAPEDFEYGWFGGIRVPSGLTGATGQLLLTTVNQAPQSTFSILIHLRNNVPQT